MAHVKITEEELIEFYKINHKINIRKEDLLRPVKDFVIDLFCRILEEFDVHDLKQPDILACNNINEHMEEAYLIINIFHVINQFVQAVGLSDFRMMDILMPKRLRTMRILHALANYYVRYNTLKVEWFDHSEKFSNLYRNRKELEKKKIDLKHSIEDKTMLLSSLKNRSLGQEKEMKTLEEQFLTKKRDADKEEKTASEIKREIFVLKEKLCGLKLDAAQTDETNKKLSQEIIGSPMRIISSRDELEKKLEAIKEENPLLKAKQNELTKRKTFFSTSKTDIVTLLKELRGIFTKILKSN